MEKYVHPFHRRRLGDCCHERICQHNTGSQTIMCVWWDTMEHIHSQSTACCVNGFWLHEAEHRGQKEFCSVSSSPNGMECGKSSSKLPLKKKKKGDGHLFPQMRVKSRQVVSLGDQTFCFTSLLHGRIYLLEWPVAWKTGPAGKKRWREREVLGNSSWAGCN